MSAIHYNLDYLKQVFQGNDAMVHRILGLFETEVPKYFEEMEARMAQGRWRELHPLAHKAKSSIGMLGMKDLLEKVLEIERESRSGTSRDEVARALAAAQNLLHIAMAEMARDRMGRCARTDSGTADGSGKTIEVSRHGKRHRA